MQPALEIGVAESGKRCKVASGRRASRYAAGVALLAPANRTRAPILGLRFPLEVTKLRSNWSSGRGVRVGSSARIWRSTSARAANVARGEQVTLTLRATAAEAMEDTESHALRPNPIPGSGGGGTARADSSSETDSSLEQLIANYARTLDSQTALLYELAGDGAPPVMVCGWGADGPRELSSAADHSAFVIRAGSLARATLEASCTRAQRRCDMRSRPGSEPTKVRIACWSPRSPPPRQTLPGRYGRPSATRRWSHCT